MRQQGSERVRKMIHVYIQKNDIYIHMYTYIVKGTCMHMSIHMYEK